MVVLWWFCGVTVVEGGVVVVERGGTLVDVIV